MNHLVHMDLLDFFVCDNAAEYIFEYVRIISLITSGQNEWLKCTSRAVVWKKNRRQEMKRTTTDNELQGDKERREIQLVRNKIKLWHITSDSTRHDTNTISN